MGEFTVFECPDCGYRSGKIRWGVGKDNTRIRFLPAHCHKCRSYMEIDLTGHDVLIEKFTCGECGSEVTFFEHVESFACPRCDSRKIRLHQRGYW